MLPTATPAPRLTGPAVVAVTTALMLVIVGLATLLTTAASPRQAEQVVAPTAFG